MSFEHAEFILWMGIPISVLFYLWMSQKPLHEHHFSDQVIEKLRVSGDTMGLRGRNILFFCAAWLMILALAEPVMRGEKCVSVKSSKIIVLDISQHSKDDFETMKKNALLEINRSLEEIELLAYDEHLYRISPATKDKQLARELVSRLSEGTIRSANEQLLEALKGELVVFSGSKRIVKPVENENEKFEKIPLFYYPLSFAMIFIALALSSMSKRQSVAIGFLLVMSISPRNVDAGILDFRILDRAYSAYERGDYRSSATLFGEYQALHDTPQIRYNRANALFKSHQYERARYWYERVYTTDPLLQSRVKYNLERLPKKTVESKGIEKEEREKSKIKKVEEKKVVVVEGKTPLFRY